MISFIGKTIEAPIHIPGKRIGVKVIWKNSKFIARLGKDEFEIDGWNDLTDCKWVYALPNNTYFTPWHRKPYMPPAEPDKSVLEMTLRFYGKYWNNMTIYGKLIDNIFYQSKPKEDEPDISEVITE